MNTTYQYRLSTRVLACQVTVVRWQVQRWHGNALVLQEASPIQQTWSKQSNWQDHIQGILCRVFDIDQIHATRYRQCENGCIEWWMVWQELPASPVQYNPWRAYFWDTCQLPDQVTCELPEDWVVESQIVLLITRSWRMWMFCVE